MLEKMINFAGLKTLFFFTNINVSSTVLYIYEYFEYKTSIVESSLSQLTL